MFSSWEEKKAFLQFNAEAEARKGWARLREYYQRHPPPHSNHYNSSQPRVPAGNPDGGQWTSVDDRVVAPEYIQVAARGSPRIPPPQVPRRPPPNDEDRKQKIKEVAEWLLAVGGSLAEILAIAPWLRKYYAELESYRDPPKTLEELRAAASRPTTPEYQDHHIGEQTLARKESVDDETIHGRENIVRIPTLKHRQITGWYGRKNKKYRPTPREYLRGKDWDEKMKVGLEALRQHGVLK